MTSSQTSQCIHKVNLQAMKTFSSLVVSDHSLKLRTQKQNHHKLLDKSFKAYLSAKAST